MSPTTIPTTDGIPKKGSVSGTSRPDGHTQKKRPLTLDQNCPGTWQRHVRVHVTDRHNKRMQAVAVSLGVELSQYDGVV